MMKSRLLLIAMLVASTTLGALSPAGRLQSDRHWAFEPARRTEPPQDPTGWSSNPIDRFIHAKLREKDLVPVEPAARRTLIRRAYFDLVGLPPAPQDVEAFQADASPDAYCRLIDLLLASPRYGERWGRHWMDVVRYADTAGDNADYPVPEIRRYRDYIIEALNADKPYNEFVREQLAGDILAKQGPPEKYAERVIATGFIALSRRYATAPFELWHLTLEDTIETTGRAFMGLTLRCARCHDHKYDPVTKEDYYGLYGIFASTQYPYAGSEEFQSKSFPRSGFIPLVPPQEADAGMKLFRETVQNLQSEIKRGEQEGALAKQLAELKTQIEAKTKEVSELPTKPQSVAATEAELASLQKQRDQLIKQLQEKLKPLRAQLAKLQRPGAPRGLPVAYAVCEGKPADALIHVRGNPEDKGPVAKRAPPKFLAGNLPFHIPEGASGRLEFAQWLTRADHPLTARVMINRIWQHHFGKGLVNTPSNFGLRGDEPTHPELLDYLAARFVESGWSIKAMHRLIMLSKTYQLSSGHAGGNAAKDSGNKRYWRFDRRRLDAESIRDAMLAAAGKLDRRRPGEHPFPALESWTFTQHSPFKAVYESNQRSVYLMAQRLQRHPYFALFDGPDPNTTTDVRTESTVAPQALFMMNHPFVLEQAAALARRVLASARSVRDRICFAHEWAWSRSPNEEEITKAAAFLAKYQDEIERFAPTHETKELEAWTSYARVLLTANEFIHLD